MKPTKSKKKTTTKRRKKTGELDELAAETKSDDEQLVFGAIDRLGEIKDPRATEILIECLKDERMLVRQFAAVQLGERQDTAAVDALIELLYDELQLVRQTAAGALENIGGKKALTAVKKAEEEGLLFDELPEGIKLKRID